MLHEVMGRRDTVVTARVKGPGRAFVRQSMGDHGLPVHVLGGQTVGRGW